MKKDFEHIYEILDNVFCGKCGVTTIVEYNGYLDEHGDVILRGLCGRCGKKAARVIETGEDPKSTKRAKNNNGKL